MLPLSRFVASTLIAFMPACSADSDAPGGEEARAVPQVDAIVSPLMEAAIQTIGYSASYTDWRNVERALKKNVTNTEVYRSLDDEYIFFLGGNCSGGIRGSLGSRARGDESVNAKNVSWFANDDTSSLLIRSASKGESILIYDHPDGLEDRAGHTLIRIHRDVTTPICLGSFEKSIRLPDQEDPVIEVTFNGRGALDGKVSRVANHMP